MLEMQKERIIYRIVGKVQKKKKKSRSLMDYLWIMDWFLLSLFPNVLKSFLFKEISITDALGPKARKE